MKISKKTLAVLKNFNDINMSIIIKPGNVLKTTTTQPRILAKAVIEDEFPVDFAVYDLKELLPTLSLFSDPDLIFDEPYSSFTISEGKQKIKYVSGQPSHVVSGWDRNITATDDMIDVKFRLKREELEQIFKASAILKIEDLAITQDGVRVYDKDNDSGNQLNIEVEFDRKPDNSFEFIIDVLNLKFIPADYEVSIASKGWARFNAVATEDNCELEYFVGIETKGKK